MQSFLNLSREFKQIDIEPSPKSSVESKKIQPNLGFMLIGLSATFPIFLSAWYAWHSWLPTATVPCTQILHSNKIPEYRSLELQFETSRRASGVKKVIFCKASLPSSQF